MNTKIEFNHNKISRIHDLAELVQLLFPGNRRHQKLALAIIVELKYADDQFLPSLEWLAAKYDSSRRVLEIVRAKMRRMGLIDHISRFNRRFGYLEGWVFSSRFTKSLSRLSELTDRFLSERDSRQERKDRDLFRYF
jgi:hypothetical protein